MRELGIIIAVCLCSAFKKENKMELNILPILNFDGKRMELNESVEVQPL